MFLITRDIDSALETQTALNCCGFSTFVEPLIKFTLLLDQLDEKKWYELNNPSFFNDKPILIFTSKNAVKALFLADDVYHNVISHIFKSCCKIIVVGNSTKNLLEYHTKNFNKDKINISDRLIACMNVDELFNCVTTSCSKIHQIIYFSGADVTKDIDVELIMYGYRMQKLILYKMLAVSEFSLSLIKKIANNEIRYVLIYSLRTTKIFFDLIMKYNLFDAVRNLTFFVLSKSIADFICANYAIKSVIFPAISNNSALLECIKNYFV